MIESYFQLFLKPALLYPVPFPIKIFLENPVTAS